MTMPATTVASSATQTTAPTTTVRLPRRSLSPPRTVRTGLAGRAPVDSAPAAHGRSGGTADAAATSTGATGADTTGIGSVRCRSSFAGFHAACRCHSSPAARHALCDRCQTDRPPAPVLAVPGPTRARGPASARGASTEADAGPGARHSSPAVRPGRPGPAASIPPGCPRRAGLRPSAGRTPRSVQGETASLAAPWAGTASLLTDRPAGRPGVSRACASQGETRYVSRPTMLAARAPAPAEIRSGASWCPDPAGSAPMCGADRAARLGHGQPSRSGGGERAAQAPHLVVADALKEPPHRHVLVAAGAQDLGHPPGVVLLACLHGPVPPGAAKLLAVEHPLAVEDVHHRHDRGVRDWPTVP